MGRKLYVGNLPYSIGEGELQELFSKAGAVESVRSCGTWPPDARADSRSSRWSTDEDAQKAVAEFNDIHSVDVRLP